jgi:alpha-ketoglutarate-dependent taurine dioxygenase
MSFGTEQLIRQGSSSLLMVQATNGLCWLPDLIQEHHARWRSKLLEHGAVLFRGYSVDSVESFHLVANAYSTLRSAYVYRSTPRTQVAEGVFTATEYPAAQEIPLHNENSYQREWPLSLAFCCLQPAHSGGETPLADMRSVTRDIGPELLERFSERKVMYVRHYRPHLDLPWQTVFQCEDPSDVAKYCIENNISHEWLDDGVLRTSQICHADARHPLTCDRIFFNQAHLFHVSSVGERGAAALIKTFGPDRLPRHARFGDGSEIPTRDLERIRHSFRNHMLCVPWQMNDVLLVDNMRVAHGRRPFTGPRRVLAALLEPYKPSGSELRQ